MRILIVEDNKKLAESLKKSLETERYAVDIAHTGQEGHELACIESYDLIVLDVSLPEMDGLTVSKRLRQEHIATPILMLTARDTVQDKIVGLDSGADDYLIKPFDFGELLARLRALLRRQQEKKSLLLQIDSLSLNPASHIVKRGEKEIELSAKEYALLEFMMRHSKQVVTKQQILDHVWGGEIDPFSNIVDVYIGYLRKKIDKAFPQEPSLMYTLKGLGYRLGK